MVCVLFVTNPDIPNWTDRGLLHKPTKFSSNKKVLQYDRANKKYFVEGQAMSIGEAALKFFLNLARTASAGTNAKLIIMTTHHSHKRQRQSPA